MDKGKHPQHPADATQGHGAQADGASGVGAGVREFLLRVGAGGNGILAWQTQESVLALLPSIPFQTNHAPPGGDKVMVGMIGREAIKGGTPQLTFLPAAQAHESLTLLYVVAGLTRRTGTTMTRPAGSLAMFDNKEVAVVAKKKTSADAAPAAGVQEKAEVAQPPRRKVQRLNFKERTLLVQALEARRDELLGDRPHHQDVADLLTEVLGFPVTPQHIRTGMADSGVSWRPGRRRWTWPLSRTGRLREKVWDAVSRLAQCESDPDVADDHARAVAAAEAFCEAARVLHRKCNQEDAAGEAREGGTDHA